MRFAVLFTAICILAVGASWMAYLYGQKYERAMTANRILATELGMGDAEVEVASNPKTGDIIVRVNRMHEHYFPQVCRPEAYF